MFVNVEVPRFENSRNVEMSQIIRAADWDLRDESNLLTGIMLAGFFVYLVQAHSFERLFLNFQVVSIVSGKMAYELSRAAVAQSVNQYPHALINEVPFAPNLCHCGPPRSV